MPQAAIRIDPATRDEIEDLNLEYAWLIDHGKADLLDTLFADDGVLIVPLGTIAGRAAIAAYGAKRAAMTTRKARHVCANIRLEAISEDRIRGTVVHMLFRHDGEGLGDPAPVAVGDWEDTYVRGADGRWRFAERKVVLVFESAAHRA